jgi:hypothetical protein
MNKLHMLALVGLIFSGVNNASMMGQEQREVLYTLHTLGQDFISVPMITQNIDMFMGVLEMNIQVNEAQLKNADKNMKNALLKSAVLFAGGVVGKVALFEASRFDCMYKCGFIKDVILYSGVAVDSVASVLVSLNIYDAWKNRSELIEAIALDKEILAKLEEIKDSMSFLEENEENSAE